MRVLMARLPTLPDLTLRKMDRAHGWGGTHPWRDHRGAGQTVWSRVPFRDTEARRGPEWGWVCMCAAGWQGTAAKSQAARTELRAGAPIGARTGLNQGWWARGVGQARGRPSPQGTETGRCRSAPQWC